MVIQCLRYIHTVFIIKHARVISLYHSIMIWHSHVLLAQYLYNQLLHSNPGFIYTGPALEVLNTCQTWALPQRWNRTNTYLSTNIFSYIEMKGNCTKCLFGIASCHSINHCLYVRQTSLSKFEQMQSRLRKDITNTNNWTFLRIFKPIKTSLSIKSLVCTQTEGFWPQLIGS